MMRDPWAILGVVPGATTEQLHAAWRKGVSRWHPDRNPSPDATLRLQEINDAYTSLRGDIAPPAWADVPRSVLAGLSGTVYGEALDATVLAPDAIRTNLDIPPLDWLRDKAVTLAVPLGIGVWTIVTVFHPADLHDGSTLVFRGAAVSRAGTATDLVLTIRVAAPVMPSSGVCRLQVRSPLRAGRDSG